MGRQVDRQKVQTQTNPTQDMSFTHFFENFEVSFENNEPLCPDDIVPSPKSPFCWNGLGLSLVCPA
jgi:hypothetical protein